ncbi:thioesterase family protein [Comamonadaceae bacterium OH2545_COT-014]|nr:thioesterase family protein [Comamonadaceae bacterium OH2545_COT-014]
MESAMPTHPLDAATALRAETGAPGTFTGHGSAAYWNMVGPYGGITAATLLRAVLQHPQVLGEPVALTVNYAGALTEGPFTVQATPVRTNRSTQHWTLSILQAGPDGAPLVTTTATAVTAVRRETWRMADVPMPDVPPPGAVPVLPVPEQGMAWLHRYEMRPISGGLPQRWDGSGEHSRTRLWMRDAPPRPLDFCALAALADAFFPRVWLRRARRVPAGTVSITIYFHASGAQLRDTGAGHVLGQASAQEFRHGFFDHTAQLWNSAGLMLATSHQIVYFKE